MMCDDLTLERRIKALKAEVADWKHSFALYHDALIRGTKAWKEAHPEVDYLPDTAKMMTWIVDRLDELEADSDAWETLYYEQCNVHSVICKRFEAELVAHKENEGDECPLCVLEAENAKLKRVRDAYIAWRDSYTAKEEDDAKIELDDALKEGEYDETE